VNLFRRFLDRRRAGATPIMDRRKPTLKEVDQRYDDAIADLERTIIGSKAISANDIQRVVIFSTFADQCEYRLVTPKYQVCKHKEHEGAGTGIAPCAESACPFMREPK